MTNTIAYSPVDFSETGNAKVVSARWHLDFFFPQHLVEWQQWLLLSFERERFSYLIRSLNCRIIKTHYYIVKASFTRLISKYDLTVRFHSAFLTLRTCMNCKKHCTPQCIFVCNYKQRLQLIVDKSHRKIGRVNAPLSVFISKVIVFGKRKILELKYFDTSSRLGKF